MKIALVTGASSGLGREFVRQIAEQGKVEEIWAIARRRDRLEALQSISAVPIRVLALDLTRPGDMEYLRNTLQDELPDIRILVNAAGMGRMGPTVDIPAKDNDAMIDLNCRAAVDVTDAAFPYLHPGSQVLEICSTAGFQPIPGLNVYAATKAFLLSYTQRCITSFPLRASMLLRYAPTGSRIPSSLALRKKAGMASAIIRWPAAARMLCAAPCGTAR